ncbi:PhoH family protein [Sporosarcina sp. E16_3]|uniref:PhoH family protein n=1 Tax=Sporosarcina sp. E16_3 TaxID=2789293 RepID=UPI001A90CCA6|nr:PhoH family protein [Sporosarcina sp. E16_3]MBO0602725.1 PhoH family protein [Sporosarcina sp. E16_3]
MAKKYGEIKWKWLAERGLDVMDDKHQYAYMQSLWTLPKELQGVFCEAAAGTGKTVLATLAGAYAVEKGEYDRIIYIRNTEVVGKEIGFLPGDSTEKTAPHMTPFISALDLVKPGTFEAWEADGKAFAISPTHERGVTYDNAFIIIDEVQSLGLDELQTIYTRPTSSCKIVSIGSLKQIDNKKLTRYGGLTPFEVYMRHFEGQRSSFHKLHTNWRGPWSLHADNVADTVDKILKGAL